MTTPKILVPIDFSPLSEKVLAFSFSLAKSLSAEITLLHIVDTTMISAEGLWLDSVEAAYQAANSRMEAFTQKHSSQHQKSMRWIVRFGVAGFTIADVARDMHMDYIVSGMRNKHGLMERWLGTTSYTVIKKSPCPVFLVHEHTIWLHPENILLACQDAHSLRLAWPAFTMLNSKFKARTKILHVHIGSLQKGEIVTARDLEQYVRELESAFPVELQVLENNAVAETVIDTAILGKADLLVVIHQGKTQWPWNSGKSLSVQMAESMPLPMLVLPLSD